MMRSVLISIKPKWCELIACGKKTIEVRKTKPKLDTPFKVYIYETKTKDHYAVFHENTVGKVVGEFVCSAILPISITYSDPNSKIAFREFPFTCLTDKEIMDYLGNGVTGYGWCISDLVIYNKPKELSEFFVYCDRCDKRPIACKFAYEENNENGYYSECVCDFKRPIERPPQSWCYVEECE